MPLVTKQVQSFAKHKDGQILELSTIIELDEDKKTFTVTADHHGRPVGKLEGCMDTTGYTKFTIATKGTDFSPLSEELAGVGAALLSWALQVTQNELKGRTLTCMCSSELVPYFKKMGMDVQISKHGYLQYSKDNQRLGRSQQPQSKEDVLINPDPGIEQMHRSDKFFSEKNKQTRRNITMVLTQEEVLLKRGKRYENEHRAKLNVIVEPASPPTPTK